MRRVHAAGLEEAHSGRNALLRQDRERVHVRQLEASALAQIRSRIEVEDDTLLKLVTGEELGASAADGEEFVEALDVGDFGVDLASQVPICCVELQLSVAGKADRGGDGKGAARGIGACITGAVGAHGGIVASLTRIEVVPCGGKANQCGEGEDLGVHGEREVLSFCQREQRRWMASGKGNKLYGRTKAMK